jgi:hypothetical protein
MLISDFTNQNVTRFNFDELLIKERQCQDLLGQLTSRRQRSQVYAFLKCIRTRIRRIALDNTYEW